ncbi:hypothetical protein DFJ77DRAFT_440371 [Powellomyces hirtus]|nr:hypothetical protein DFJ77DRAFT_440371 [Powellomyces hirtus]
MPAPCVSRAECTLVGGLAIVLGGSHGDNIGVSAKGARFLFAFSNWRASLHSITRMSDGQEGDSWEDDWETAEAIAAPAPVKAPSVSAPLSSTLGNAVFETDKITYVPQVWKHDILKMKVKLLKRDGPKSGGVGMERSASGSSGGKSLAEREAQYAAARARIFAETSGGSRGGGSESPKSPTNAIRTPSPATSAAARDRPSGNTSPGGMSRQRQEGGGSNMSRSQQQQGPPSRGSYGNRQTSLHNSNNDSINSAQLRGLPLHQGSFGSSHRPVAAVPAVFMDNSTRPLTPVADRRLEEALFRPPPPPT